MNYVFLLFTNRCGSNFLAQILASTAQFNEAGEFFNAETILSHARERRLASVQDYFSVLPTLVPHRGWLATKLACDNLSMLVETGIIDAVADRSHFILLERQDLVAQAISRVIASQNLCWTSEQERSVPDECLIYSRSLIEDQIHQIRQENGYLCRFLASRSIQPLHFAYEALVKRPQDHIDQIAKRLQIPRLEVNPSLVRISCQANAVNRAWRKRYDEGR